MERCWRVVDTWNGGLLKPVVRFTSTAAGDAGHNECFRWIQQHTPFSFEMATQFQGYIVEHVPPAVPTFARAE